MRGVDLHICQRDQVLEFAGAELLRHLEMLGLDQPFGIEYPIWLDTELEGDPSQDSFSYHFSSTEGRISGSSSRSALLGVYDYLRHLGFVFHCPGPEGTFVPQGISAEQLLCPPVTRRPDFMYRGVCIEGADSLENILEFIDWLPKNGYNAFFLQFKTPDVFLERWYHHLFNPHLAPQKLSREALDEMEKAITVAMEKRGIQEHRVGHGWTAQVIGFDNTGWHTEQRQLTPDEQALVAQVGGKRELFGGVPTNTNLCYANPEARRRMVEQIVEYAKSHPTVDCLHVWLADECNNVCECPACTATTLSDQYVSILNQLDDALTQEGLTTKIVFLLYQELLYVPLRERLKNTQRFCLMFAPISRTFEKSYPRGRQNVKIRPYMRNHFHLPETVEENLAHYFSWKETFTGDSFFYDYPLGRAHYGDFGYMKIARVIYEDIHALRGLQSNGYMSCQELRAMNPTSFPNYVMGQALLDECIPYGQMKETYFTAVFGPKGKIVSDYLERLSRLSDTDYFNGHGPRVQPEKQNAFQQIAQTAQAFLQTIEQPQVQETLPEPYRPQWEFLRFHGRYCILLAQALEQLCMGNQTTADEKFQAFCTYIQSCELKIQRRLDVYRIIEVATKYTGFTPISQ